MSSARNEPTRIHELTTPVANSVATPTMPNVENLLVTSPASDANSKAW
jgi:hypothetical protein